MSNDRSKRVREYFDDSIEGGEWRLELVDRLSDRGIFEFWSITPDADTYIEVNRKTLQAIHEHLGEVLGYGWNGPSHGVRTAPVTASTPSTGAHR